jgi:hypothetical protein
VRTAAKVFAGSGLFGLAVAGAYWIVSAEPAGTALLAVMGLAALVVAALATRAAPRPGAESPADRPDARPAEGAGETVAAFPWGSVWPPATALGAVLAAGGLVFRPWLAIVGGVTLAVALVGLARESRS